MLFYSPKTRRDEVSSDHLRSSPTKLNRPRDSLPSKLACHLPPQNASAHNLSQRTIRNKASCCRYCTNKTNILFPTKSKINALRMLRLKSNYLLVSYLTHENYVGIVRYHRSVGNLLEQATSYTISIIYSHDIIMQAMIHQSQLL
jgi:hypothetical protein